jgi:phosphatidylglycerol:prolipoprotein diacylglycerol transferase
VFPYLPNPITHVGPIPIVLFPFFLAAGWLVGLKVTLDHGKMRGLDRRRQIELVVVVFLLGFAGAHWFDVAAYTPERLARRPWIVLEFWRGLSSYGGFVGAFVGFLWWTKRRGLDRLAYADPMGAGLSVGWIFGRLGCYTAHDHPGARTDFFMAVPYPDGTRHDLGLYEALATMGIAFVVTQVAARKPPSGTVIALSMVLYAPVRFALDFLRATDVRRMDPRYFGLTPAQWISIATLVFGLWLLQRSRLTASSAAATPTRRG